MGATQAKAAFSTATWDASGMEMKVTVILTTHNHEKYIEQALESVLMQGGPLNSKLLSWRIAPRTVRAIFFSPTRIGTPAGFV